MYYIRYSKRLFCSFHENIRTPMNDITMFKTVHNNSKLFVVCFNLLRFSLEAKK